MSFSEALVVFGATYLVYVQILAAAIVVWYFRKTKFPILRYALASGVIAFVFARISSAIFDNPRPFVEERFTPLVAHAADNGFPSDHTLLAAWLAAVIFVLDRRIGIAFAVVAFAIGLSRVMAGVHHIEDIIGSLVIVAISATLAHSKIFLR